MSHVQMAPFIYSFVLHQMQALLLLLHAAITAAQPNVPMNNKSQHKEIKPAVCDP